MRANTQPGVLQSGTPRHKARMPYRKLSHIAVHQVEAHGQHHIDAHKHENQIAVVVVAAPQRNCDVDKANLQQAGHTARQPQQQPVAATAQYQRQDQDGDGKNDAVIQEHPQQGVKEPRRACSLVKQVLEKGGEQIAYVNIQGKVVMPSLG